MDRHVDQCGKRPVGAAELTSRFRLGTGRLPPCGERRGVTCERAAPSKGVIEVDISPSQDPVPPRCRMAVRDGSNPEA
jgi:hypothetical protein